MDTSKLLSELRQEYSELGQTIRTLERRTGNSASGKAGTNKPRRVWTAAQKKALSLAAKKRWAVIKAKKKG